MQKWLSFRASVSSTAKWKQYLSETFRRIKGHAALEAPSTKIIIWDFLEGPVVKTAIPIQGAKARSLVKELRSHVLHEVAK